MKKPEKQKARPPKIRSNVPAKLAHPEERSGIVAKKQGDTRTPKATASPPRVELRQLMNLDIGRLGTKILERLRTSPTKSLNRCILARSMKLDSQNLGFSRAVAKLTEEEIIRVRLGGQGGTLVLLDHPIIGEPDQSDEKENVNEASLYTHIATALKVWFVPSIEVKDGKYILNVTAWNRSPGKWSRPDLSLLAIREYTILQARGPLVVTFEIKKKLDSDIASLLQAKAYLRFSHFSFLVVKIPKQLGEEEKELLNNLLERCTGERVGLITFTDAKNSESFDAKYNPIDHHGTLSSPAAKLLDKFITEQFCQNPIAASQVIRLTCACGRIESQW